MCTIIPYKLHSIAYRIYHIILYICMYTTLFDSLKTSGKRVSGCYKYSSRKYFNIPLHLPYYLYILPLVGEEKEEVRENGKLPSY